MPAVTLKGADGKTFTAFICGRSRGRRCNWCGRNDATRLCDYPVGRHRTCDMPICDRCATSVGPELDYCPKHKSMQPPPSQGDLFDGKEAA